MLVAAAAATSAGPAARSAEPPAGWSVLSVREDGTASRIEADVAPDLLGTDGAGRALMRTPPGDRILVARPDALRVANFNGSAAVTITVPGMKISDAESAAFSSDGRLVAYTAGTSDDCRTATCGDLYLARADGSAAPRYLMAHAGNPAWSHDSEFVAFLGGLDRDRATLFVARSDGSELRVLAADVPAYASPSFAPTGDRLAYGCGDQSHYGLCVQHVSSGRLERKVAALAYGFIWSPGSRRIATSLGARGVNHSTLGVVDLATRNVSSLTTTDINGDNDTPLAWSPDGTQVAFQRTCEYGPPLCRTAVYALTLKSGRKHRLSRDNRIWTDVRWRDHRLSYVAVTAAHLP